MTPAVSPATSLARYGAYNLIWSLSGEYQYAYSNNAFSWTSDDWRILGNAVQSWNPYRHPVSIHPSGRQGKNAHPDWPPNTGLASSAGEFHHEPWLDHNWLQTGHAVERLWRVPFRLAENYDKIPARPIVHSEGFYENHRDGCATPAQVRWQAWAAYLNGATGHGYGGAGVWQFFDPTVAPGRDRANSAPPDGTTWQEALAYAGASQLEHLHAFFTAIPWWTLAPHRDRLHINGSPPDVRSLTDPHCATSPGDLCVIYIPEGNSDKTIQIAALANCAWTARWYNPRDGASLPLNSGASFTPEDLWTFPSRPDNDDWLLHLTAVKE